MNKLPNVDAGYFLAALKIQETMNKAPMLAADHQAAVASLRSMVEHAEALTEELAKAKEEIAKLRSQPAKE